MPKPQKYRDVIKFLKSQGWILIRQGKGSHEIWGAEEGIPYISIPRHKEISAGIIKQIIQHFPDAPNDWR